ncbi:MAG: hypothetical protein H0W30_09685 [Gemmatimonadaceae bacterium]|nr:hypothetical protein [Gemmatimonadaceae bacterium]
MLLLMKGLPDERRTRYYKATPIPHFGRNVWRETLLLECNINVGGICNTVATQHCELREAIVLRSGVDNVMHISSMRKKPETRHFDNSAMTRFAPRFTFTEA